MKSEWYTRNASALGVSVLCAVCFHCVDFKNLFLEICKIVSRFAKSWSLLADFADSVFALSTFSKIFFWIVGPCSLISCLDQPVFASSTISSLFLSMIVWFERLLYPWIDLVISDCIQQVSMKSEWCAMETREFGVSLSFALLFFCFSFWIYIPFHSCYDFMNNVAILNWIQQVWTNLNDSKECESVFCRLDSRGLFSRVTLTTFQNLFWKFAKSFWSFSKVGDWSEALLSRSWSRANFQNLFLVIRKSSCSHFRLCWAGLCREHSHQDLSQ